ncbi:MAG: DNA polymerase III subunit gamma/tau [Oscillospiraceae bacterium]|nr:DNA polymerase III subunit gamma/tau [Oscillospiraceae bacterium]
MYKALYSKYRPLTFDDVVSQPHITRTLLNQITGNKTAHAYLFTGSRGTGKTTCARILAKAINCEHSKDGNPCLECDICRDADNDALSDIIEIDAASNGSVNDAREIKEAAEYMPERCRYKVYIIDEVHMLSTEAFNALLKLIEEPPAHVKFILATTEIHKVLPTILSRCQRFDFRRINAEDIKNRLLYVAEQESIELDPDAAELIAKTADGGMRDALSLLDQCIAFSEHITAETVAEAAGIAGREYLFEIMEAAASKDAAKAVTVIKRLYELSKDMQKLVEELIAQFRNVMLAKSVPGCDDVLVCMPAETETIKSLAEKMTENEIFGSLDILQKCSERLARVPSKRVEVEMCMIKLCTSANTGNGGSAIDNSEIYAKIDLLEKKIAAGVPSAANRPYRSEPQYAQPVQPVQSKAAEPAPQAAVPQESPKGAVELDPDKFSQVECWAEIFELFSQSCPSVSGALTGSYATEQDNYMIIYSDNSFFLSLLKNKENSAKLMEAIYNVTGKKYHVRAKFTGAKEEQGGSPLQKLLDKAKDSGIPTETN